jgi:SAM-dependent methyltransferase
MIYKHLSEFTGLSKQLVLRKIAEGVLPLTEEWFETNPKTPAEKLEFYKHTDGYLWDLTNWHMHTPQRVHDEKLAERIRGMRPRLVLDYGCGIGVSSMALARRGIKSFAYDVPSRTLEFCKYRVEHLGLADLITVTDNKRKLKYEKFDIVLCLDVIEHMPTPHDAIDLAEELTTYAPVVLYNLSLGNESGMAPMHLPYDRNIEAEIKGILDDHNAKAAQGPNNTNPH